MSAGFIPMVSTTPPPIDDEDDDFTDFMDSKHNEEFEDFTSPVGDDDDSFPSMSTPPKISRSSFQEDENALPSKNPSDVDDSVFQNEKEFHKDIEIILQESEISETVKKTDVLPTHVKQTTNNMILEGTLPHGDGNIESNGFDNDNSIKPEIPTKMKPSSISPTTNEISSKELDENANDLPENGDSESEDWMDFAESPPHENGLDGSEFCSSSSPSIEFKEGSSDEVKTSIPENLSDLDLKVSDPNKEGFNDASNEELPPKSSSHDEETSEVSSEHEVITGAGSCEKLDADAADTFVANFSGNSSQQDSASTESEDKLEDINGDAVTPSEELATNFLDDGTCHESDDELEDFQSTTVCDEQPEPNDTSDNFESPPQINHLQNGDVDDEDFGDFSSLHVTAPTSETCHLKTGEDKNIQNDAASSFDCDFAAFDAAADNGAGDDFADFSAATKSELKGDHGGGWPDEAENTAFSAFGSQSDDFGAFASEGNEDDFGDFSSSSASAWTSASEHVVTIVPVHEKINNYVSCYTRRKEDEKLEESSISLLEEKLKTEILSKDSETHSTLSVDPAGIVWPGNLWDQLEDIDNAIALNFVWNGSGHNKHLLDSLGMHTQNILFSGSKQAYYVPTYYAAGLGMIDPSKGILKPMSAAERITAISPSEKNAPVSMEESVSPAESYQEWKSVADKHGSGGRMVVEGSGSWSPGGGLVDNPDMSVYGHGIAGGGTSTENSTAEDPPVPVISLTMDLDYFDTLPAVQAGTRPPGDSDLIDPELLELTTAPTTGPPPPAKDGGAATLSKILASIKSAGNSSLTATTTIGGGQDTSKWEEEENKLSQEARSVLLRLPDLSYMRSKVLMFPMNMSRVNMAEDV